MRDPHLALLITFYVFMGIWIFGFVVGCWLIATAIKSRWLRLRK